MKLTVALFSLVFLAAVFAREKLPVPDTSEIVTLDPFKVKGQAVGSFAIDIRIIVDGTTKKVKAIIVVGVKEDSDAADLGLQAGDQIVKIDGVPVENMEPNVNRTSQIGQIFLNRQPGEMLNLEIVTRRTRQVTLRSHYPRRF